MHPKSYSRHIPAYLKSHQCQGQSNNCGPYSLAILLNALLGLQISGDALASEMDRPVGRFFLPFFRRIPQGATFPWGLVDVLRKYHMDAHWRLFSPVQRLLDGLAGGEALILILGTWRPFWFHIAVLAAYDPEKGWGLVNSAREEAALDWLAEDDFLQKWNGSGRMCVFARLKKEGAAE